MSEASPHSAHAKTCTYCRLLCTALRVAIINVGLIALALTAFEALFSPYSALPKNGYIDFKLYTWGHLVTHNRYGFREREFEPAKPPGTYRVIVLGDSLTWGTGLRLEDRYTAIAERLLNRALDHPHFEILNFSLEGAPTTVERDTLVQISRQIPFDQVVVGFCSNDPQPWSQDYSIERDRLEKSLIGRTIQGTSAFLTDSGLPYVGSLVHNGFYLSAEKVGAIPTWQVALQRTYEPASAEWRNFAKALEDIRNISLGMTVAPPLFSVLNSQISAEQYRHPDENVTRSSRWYHEAEKLAAQAGFKTFNHEDEIIQHLGDESPCLNVVDCHPSAHLNRIYGEKLFHEIAKQFAPQMQPPAAASGRQISRRQSPIRPEPGRP